MYLLSEYDKRHVSPVPMAMLYMLLLYLRILLQLPASSGLSHKQDHFSEDQWLYHNHTAEPEDPPAPEYRRKLYHRMNHRKPL